jgi:hypothetical protein
MTPTPDRPQASAVPTMDRAPAAYTGWGTRSADGRGRGYAKVRRRKTDILSFIGSHLRRLRGRSSAPAAGDPDGARVEYPSVPSDTGRDPSNSLPAGQLPIGDASCGLAG